MTRYTKDNLGTIETGWYWAREYPGAPPECVVVFWERPDKVRLCIDFGYCREVYFSPDSPCDNDGSVDTVVLTGPIPVPSELR